MNLLVELSNGELEEVEVDDAELLYHEFWGNEESMAEAQEILYELQQQCASMSSDVAELKAYTKAKLEHVDTDRTHLYEYTLPPILRAIENLEKRMRHQEQADAVDSSKMSWLVGFGGIVVGAVISALATTFF